MTTFPATLPPEFSDLTARLDAVGGRFRLAAVLSGLARFLVLMVPLTLAFLFFAGLWTLAPWVHVSMLVVLLAGLIGGYLAFLHFPLFRQPTYAEIARLIEFHGDGRLASPAPAAPTDNGDPPPGRLDNALINAVLLAQDYQLAQSHQTGGGGGSSTWIPHVLREASTATLALPLERAVPWRQPRNHWLAAAVVLCLCAIPLVLYHHTFTHGLAVLTAPTRFVPHQGSVRILSVVPGNDSAIIGQPLSFSILVDAPDHRNLTAQIAIRYASGTEKRLPMTALGSENSQYVRQGVIAVEDMDYIITAGDTQSERYHITVLPQLHLQSLTGEITPPLYTGRPKYTVSLVKPDPGFGKNALEAPLGSAITLKATLDGPAHELLLDGASATPQAPQPLFLQSDGRSFVLNLSLKEPLRFTLRANDSANRTLQQFPASTAGVNSSAAPDFFTITPTPDAPPHHLGHHPRPRHRCEARR